MPVYAVVVRRYLAVMFAMASLVPMASIVSAAADGASFKLDVLRGYPIVGGVFVSGHGPYRFLLDTGSTLNHLEPKLGKSIGLAETFRTDVATVSGVTSFSGAENIAVALGTASAQAQTFILGGLDVVHDLSSDIRGILGQAFLSRFDYRIDLKASRLSFGADDRPGTRVTFRWINGRPAVPTNLGWMILDSGAHGLVVYGVLAPGNAFGMTTISGSRDVGTVARQLRIGGTLFWSGDAAAVPDVVEDGVAGLLPMSFFRSVYVSNSGGYVVLD